MTLSAETLPTTLVPQVDEKGRPTISDAIRASVREAFAAVPAGKKSALLVISDEHGTRGMLAWKIDEHWTVAGGGGVEWPMKKPTGFVAVQGAWGDDD